jgi:26S proteasome regulatory subunit N5
MACVYRLLDKSPDEMEENLSRLVVAKSVYAKIDRPNKVVNFRESEDASGQLNSWAGDISGLLALVEKSCHLIAREEMIAKTKKK